MAVEALAPDALLVQTNLTGAVADIDEDPDSPDGDWLTQTSGGAATECRVSFPTPSGDLATGAGLQEFRLWLRSGTNSGFAGNGSETADIYLWEGGSLVATLDTGVSVGEMASVLSYTWDASSLASVDGSGVELRVVGNVAGGGGPAGSRAAIEIGALEFNADVAEAAVFTLEAATGSYSTAGQSAGLKRQLQMAAAVGAFALTGVAAGLSLTVKLQAASGSYSLSGQAAQLTAQRELGGVSGEYALSGAQAGLLRGLLLQVDTGSYALTGAAAEFSVINSLPAATGAYALTGEPVDLLRGLRFGVDAGAYSLGGVAADLTHDTGGYTLEVATGVYTLTGVAADLTSDAAPGYPMLNVSQDSTALPDAGITASMEADSTTKWRRDQVEVIYAVRLLHEWITQTEYEQLIDFIAANGYGPHIFSFRGDSYSGTLVNEPAQIEQRGSIYRVESLFLATKV